MARFLKHIGKHNDRKVVIIFRELPGEPHMALVVYPEVLNTFLHDAIMTALESEAGQHAETFADVLHRSYTKDGRVVLQVLHAEGLLKKVQTEQIVVTPNVKSNIKLSELNTMLNEMRQGEAAIKRMAELDASRGLQDPSDVRRRQMDPMMNENKKFPKQERPNPVTAAQGGAFTDSMLAESRLQQAQRMAAEAQGLLMEAERLKAEAYDMNPALAPAPTKKPAVKKTVAKTTAAKKPAVKKTVAEAAPAPKATRGRKKAVAE